MRVKQAIFLVGGRGTRLGALSANTPKPMQEIAPGVVSRFVTIPTLIAMKAGTGRARDQDDIEHLRMIQEESGDESGR